MNIFVTFLSPIDSAIALDDKRVVKMTLESAQMLSTAIYFYGGNAPYKPNHINHPCSIWVRTSKANYQWLLDHFMSLCEEYKYRYSRDHKCSELYEVFKEGKKYIPDGDLTSFADCTTLSKKYDSLTDITERYKQCMINKWINDKREPNWKGRKKPDWFEELTINN